MIISLKKLALRYLKIFIGENRFRRNFFEQVLFYFHHKRYPKISNQQTKNIEGFSRRDIDISKFSSKNRLEGISGCARLKNADDFLEPVILSYIDHFDEIILVNNNSSDNTKDICLDLLRKFPEKIKYYEYEPEVYPPKDMKNKTVENNSIHSLSYFYNWCFSKTNYKRVTKIDDDNLANKLALEGMVQKIRSITKPCVFHYTGYNIISRNNDFFIVKNIDYRYSGFFGDINFFYVSEYTYFSMNRSLLCEELYHNYKTYWYGIIYYHLKFLKKDYGLYNHPNDNRKVMAMEAISFLKGKFVRYIDNYLKEHLS